MLRPPEAGKGATEDEVHDVHVLEWSRPQEFMTSVVMAPLAEYKLRSTFALPHLVLSIFDELSESSGLVLLTGTISSSAASAPESTGGTGGTGSAPNSDSGQSTGVISSAEASVLVESMLKVYSAAGFVLQSPTPTVPTGSEASKDEALASRLVHAKRALDHLDAFNRGSEHFKIQDVVSTLDLLK